MIKHGFSHQSFSIDEELKNSIENCLGSTIDREHTLYLITISPDPKKVFKPFGDTITMPYDDMHFLSQVFLLADFHKTLFKKFGFVQLEVHFEQGGVTHAHSIVETRNPLSVHDIEAIQKFTHKKFGRGKTKHKICCDFRIIKDLNNVVKYVNKQNAHPPLRIPLTS